AEAAAKQAADEAAAKQAADEAAEQPAAEAAAKQAADEAAAKQAADEAAAKQAAEAAAKQAADDAAAKQAADEAAAKQAAEAAARQAADEAAAKQAAEDAAKADPVARQKSFLAGFVAPECVHIHLLAAKPEGFVLDGFANAPLPLKALAKEWRVQTDAKPDVVARLVNQEQCPVLDFMNHHVTAGAQVVKVILSNQDEVVKSGGTVSGIVEGLQGRFLTLFLVSGGGGATNLQPLVVMGADGSASFSLTVSLAKDAPPAPQLLLALATSERIARLDEVPNGVTAKSLIPFIESQTAVSDSELDTGLGYFRLEN
ncbi:MAG: hypothetical protein KBF27_09365, partial [Cypionkella sp.]|nr:hypothetical protein [Cypionkella sp.]